jgi:hypothetical protein
MWIVGSRPPSNNHHDLCRISPLFLNLLRVAYTVSQSLNLLTPHGLLSSTTVKTNSFQLWNVACMVAFNEIVIMNYARLRTRY